MVWVECKATLSPLQSCNTTYIMYTVLYARTMFPLKHQTDSFRLHKDLEVPSWNLVLNLKDRRVWVNEALSISSELAFTVTKILRKSGMEMITDSYDLWYSGEKMNTHPMCLPIVVSGLVNLVSLIQTTLYNTILYNTNAVNSFQFGGGSI